MGRMAHSFFCKSIFFCLYTIVVIGWFYMRRINYGYHR
nr:MAG TPA: hypothetical protein [Caudoviricetes sp.]